MREHLKKIKILKNLVLRYRVLRDYTLNIKHDCLTQEIPWIVPEAAKWLGEYLKKDMIAFEWGSGGSTIFIAKRVKRLITVEYFKEWFVRVKMYLWMARIFNCHLILKEAEYDGNKHSVKEDYIKGYKSDNPDYPEYNFRDFCQSIRKYSDNYFDFILIDGRARTSCLLEAKDKVKIGGYIMLDDSDRERYKAGTLLLTNFKRIDFSGQAPYLDFLQDTSIFKRIK